MDPGSKDAQGRANGLLVTLLIASLIGNALLVDRLARELDRSDRLDARVATLEDRLGTLRDDLRTTEGDGPLARLAATVAELRGLMFLREVKADAITPAAMTERIRSSFKDENPSDEIRTSQKILARLGVVAADDDLYGAIRDAYGEQVAGFYDSETKELVVTSRDATDPGPLDRLILAHEYTHALTDQHFGLDRIERLRDQKQDEAVAAFQALTEGDAQYTMGIYRDEVLTDDERARLVEESQQVGISAFSRLPEFLQQAFTFPYDAGTAFAAALRQAGGWKAVDAAYEDPPVSTEQILHPERYLGPTRDEPTDVTPPKVLRELGQGWRALEDGGIGELDIRLLLDTSIGTNLSGPQAARAADGWDGGAYTAVEGPAGTLVAMETVWDTTVEAREAEQAFRRWLPMRYPGATPIDLGPGVIAYAGPDGAAAVSRTDARLAIVLAPDVDSLRAATRATRRFT